MARLIFESEYDLVPRSEYSKVPILWSLWVYGLHLADHSVPEWYTVEGIGYERFMLLLGIIVGAGIVTFSLILTSIVGWLLGFVTVTF